MSAAASKPDLTGLTEDLARLRGDPSAPPDASVVVPVNAQADLERVLGVLADVSSYRGRHTFEVVLVVNNYPRDDPPAELGAFGRAGMRVLGVPSVWRMGEAVCFTARMPGVRAAASAQILLFDADSRILNPSAVLDWYISQFEGGAAAAYTRVGHYGFRPLLSVRARIASHHLARWIKRVLLRIPTTRGSNYAVERSLFLRLYEEGLLTDDLNVGPAVKSAGGRVVYSGSKRLEVLTSGRKFRGGWRRLAHYLRYRLAYNVVALRLEADGKGKRRNPYHRKPLR